MPHIYAQVNPIIAHMLNETLNDNSIGIFTFFLQSRLRINHINRVLRGASSHFDFLHILR